MGDALEQTTNAYSVTAWVKTDGDGDFHDNVIFSKRGSSGGGDNNEDSTSVQRQQQIHRRPVSKGGASSNLSRSRPGSPSACSFISAKNAHLAALPADAQDYYNGNYLLSVPSEILAGKHEAPLSRPTNRTTHDIIHHFKPNADGNTATIQALGVAAVKFVEERYKPTRSGLYSDIPTTATHFLPRDAVGSDDRSLVTHQHQQNGGNNSDVSIASLSINSHVGAATRAMPTSLVPMRKKVTRDRLRTWRTEGGAMSWASEGQISNNNIRSVRMAHEKKDSWWRSIIRSRYTYA